MRLATRLLGSALAAAVSLAAGARAARADDPSPSPSPPRALTPGEVQGVERQAAEPGDSARSLGSALLYIPRATAQLVFLATGAASGLIEDQQVVPRVRELVSGRGAVLFVFPTAFVETGQNPNVGARMIARAGESATSLRAGFGGPNEIVVESRIRFGSLDPLPLVLDLEALYDRSTDLEYLGVGQVPEEDPRNRFVGAPRSGLYRESKVRGIVSLGVRPVDDLEVFLSSSVTSRSVDDAPDTGSSALSRVFAPGSVLGAPDDTRVFYGELALRLDTRLVRGEPSRGLLLEGYGGAARGTEDGDVHFGRAGGRFALFFPIVRRTNIVSPKIAVDRIFRFPGATVPFTELTRQPEFRGIDNRRDDLSVVTSLDYRFVILRYLAGRVFADAALVAPGVTDLDFLHTRFAAGVGVDLFSSSATIGQLAVAAGPDGARVLLSFGVAPGFGDRQHRD